MPELDTSKLIASPPRPHDARKRGRTPAAPKVAAAAATQSAPLVTDSESAEDTGPPPATPQEACQRAVDALVKAFPKIIQAQIAKAEKGSYQHAKFLCDFAGFSAALASPDAAAQEESLAGLLLRQLQIGEDEEESAVGESTPLP